MCKAHEKLKASGEHKDTGSYWMVEQAVFGGLIDLDNDLTKCVTNDRRP